MQKRSIFVSDKCFQQDIVKLDSFCSQNFLLACSNPPNQCSNKYLPRIFSEHELGYFLNIMNYKKWVQKKRMFLLCFYKTFLLTKYSQNCLGICFVCWEGSKKTEQPPTIYRTRICTL